MLGYFCFQPQPTSSYDLNYANCLISPGRSSCEATLPILLA